MDVRVMFERYVNSKDNQTCWPTVSSLAEFERYVNSKDNQTDHILFKSR